MKAPIKYQTIIKNGKPTFAILDYNDFLKIYPIANNYIPNEVMRSMINKNFSRIKAWREYLHLTQKEVAERMNITQAALSQIETSKSKVRKATLEKLAKALGITIEQLR